MEVDGGGGGKRENIGEQGEYDTKKEEKKGKRKKKKMSVELHTAAITKLRMDTVARLMPKPFVPSVRLMGRVTMQSARGASGEINMLGREG